MVPNKWISLTLYGHNYIPIIINDSIKCNTIYDTGAANEHCAETEAGMK